MKNWKEMKPGKPRWQAYMKSPEWRELAYAVRQRCHGICESCGQREMYAAHHETYERRYAEKLTDLIGVCFICHEFKHGRIPIEEVYDAQFTPEPMPIDVVCERCGIDRELIGRTGDKWYCEECSMALEDETRRTLGWRQGKREQTQKVVINAKQDCERRHSFK